MIKEKYVTTCESGGKGNENETELLTYVLLQCICRAGDDYGQIVKISSQNRVWYHIDDISYQTDKGYIVLIDNKTTLRWETTKEMLVKGYQDFLKPQISQEKLIIKITAQSLDTKTGRLKKILSKSREIQQLNRFKNLLAPKELELYEECKEIINKQNRSDEEIQEEEIFLFMKHFYIELVNLEMDENPIKALADKTLADFFQDIKIAKLEIRACAVKMKQGQEYSRVALVRKFSHLLNPKYTNPSDLPRRKEAPFFKIVAMIGGWHRDNDKNILSPYVTSAFSSYQKFLESAEQVIATAFFNRNDEVYEIEDHDDLLVQFQNDIFANDLEKLKALALEIFLNKAIAASQRLKQGVAKTINFLSKNGSSKCKDAAVLISSEIFKKIDVDHIYILQSALPELAEAVPKGFLLAIKRLVPTFSGFLHAPVWKAFIRTSRVHTKDSCFVLVRLAKIKGNIRSSAIETLSQILAHILNKEFDEVLSLFEEELLRETLHATLIEIRKFFSNKYYSEECPCSRCIGYKEKRQFYSKIFIKFIGKDPYLCLLLKLLDVEVVDQFIFQQYPPLREEIKNRIWVLYKCGEFRRNDRHELKIKSLCKKLKPKSYLDRIVYLFAFSSWNFNEESLYKTRNKVLQHVLKTFEISGLRKLIEKVDNPALIGEVLKQDCFQLYDAQICSLIPECNKCKKITWFFEEYLKERDCIALLKSQKDQWTPSQKTHFLALFPFTPVIYRRVQNIGLENEYWAVISEKNIRAGWFHIATIVPNLSSILLELKRDRTVSFFMEYLLEKKYATPNGCIEFLQKLKRNSLNDIIPQVLEFLQESELDEKQTKDLIDLEIKYLSSKEFFRNFHPKTLNKKASQDPNFFYEMVMAKNIPFSSCWNILPQSPNEFIERLEALCCSVKEFKSVQDVLAYGASKCIDNDIFEIEHLSEDFHEVLEKYPILRECFFSYLSFNKEKISSLPLVRIVEMKEKFIKIKKSKIAEAIETTLTH